MKKVLIVDDFEHILAKLRSICESFGFEIAITTVLCKNAEEAERAIAENEPDILFLDYQFTNNYNDRNGADVARWIDKTYELPIAVATHTQRSEEESRELFSGTRCITHFVKHDKERIREFLEHTLLP
mgnify:CR=1 FL=1